MKRHYITLGSYTTAGGVVVSATSRKTLDGARAAVEGDKIACPSCKSTGRIVCTGPRIPDVCDGKAMALENDFCVCGCVPPPRLIPAQSRWFQTIEGSGKAESGEAVAERVFQNADGNWVRIKEPGSDDDPYDEQAHLVASAIAGVPYYIETMDGRTFSGRIDENGLLPRIDTYGEDEYNIYLGDDALIKMNENKA